MQLIETFLEVTLTHPEDFLKIKETLTRIGIASRKDKTLYQSCHILHKKNRYYLVHFKEMFLLDGREADFSDDDKARRNTIANLLQDWGLCFMVAPTGFIERVPMSTIKILPHKEKREWRLVPKYTVGRG